MVLIGNPVHAIGNRAVGNASRRSGATRAAFGNDGEFLGPFLARGFDADGFRLALDNFPYGNVVIGQVVPPRPAVKTFSQKEAGRSTTVDQTYKVREVPW
jgi:hypothetical protein